MKKRYNSKVSIQNIQNMQDLEITENSENSDTQNVDEIDYRRYIIELIMECIYDENYNINYYSELYNLATIQRDKANLRQIYLDAMKHLNMFSELYKMLSIESPPSLKNFDEVSLSSSEYLEEIQNSVEEKVQSANFYRMIMTLFDDLLIRDMLFEAMVDEQGHAQLLGGIYTRNL